MNVVLLTVICLSLFFLHETVAGKYKICVVDGKGGFQKASKHCPRLNVPESQVECVQGIDRFDCLRKIRKGKADFSIFTPEDLVAAANTYNDVLITTELRTGEKEQYEQQLVAIVSAASGIENTFDLKDKVLCHSGYTNDGILSAVLNDFLETSIVRPQSCETSLTVPENRIKSASKYFKAACKPGPWVNDRDLDYELKSKYSNLCAACSNPSSCSTDDQYYGKTGSLLCLRDGSGDVAWTTLAVAKIQFELHSNSTPTNDFKFLCRDDTTRALSAIPCVWVAKPWAVIAASTPSAPAVQKIIANASHSGLPWQQALFDLMEVVNYHIEVHSLYNVEPVESYLLRIPGFLSANSFTGCHPPRTVKICTTSIASKYKCDWMREAAEVRGVAPDIDCLKADNLTHCFRAIQRDVADVVIADPDHLHLGISKYELTPLFYETVHEENKEKIVAVVKSNSNIRTFEDLKGKKVCFPMYEGMAWNSVLSRLQNELIGCPYEKAIHDYFGESCVPDVPEDYREKLGKLCESRFEGDKGALDCLIEKDADVAFVTTKSINSYINESSTLRISDFRVVCDSKPCHLSWAPVGQAMVYRNLTSWRRKDILDAFLQLDLLFGQNYKEATRVFTMYGPFNGEDNVLFHDTTKELRKVPVLKNFDKMPRQYEDVLKGVRECREGKSDGRRNSAFGALILISLLMLV